MATRREFLQTAGAIGAGLIANELVGGEAMKGSAAASGVSGIVMMDGVELSKAIHSKEVSCREVMTSYLDHIARVNPKVNAIVSLQEPEGLLKQAAERDAQLGAGSRWGGCTGFRMR